MRSTISSSVLNPIFFAITGALVGSFINAALYRVRKRIKIGGRARSKCPHCKHVLSAGDLVPILSYVFLRGRCRYCGKPIGYEYPLIEAITLLVFLVTYLVRAPETAYQFGQLVFLLVIFSFFIFITFYDLRHRLILTKIVYPLGIISGLYVLLLYLEKLNIWTIYFSLIGAFAGFGFFYFLYFISKGNWMGGGDVRLSFVIGLLTGKLAFLSFFIAFVSGSVIGLMLLAVGSFGKKKHLIPFGPFLVLGCFITLLFGEQIIEWYYKVSYPLLLIFYGP